MIEKRADVPHAITLGADKGYDAADFVNELRAMNVRPHVARRLRGSAIDRRTVALIWIAHISFDRAVGFGLKQGISFRNTHLVSGDVQSGEVG